MERVDVPGVEGGRPVVVELEAVAELVERLAAARLLDEALELAAGAEGRAKRRVLEHDPIAVFNDRDAIRGFGDDPGPVARALDPDELAVRRLGHFLALSRDRVDRRLAGAVACEGPERSVAKACSLGEDPLEIAFSVGSGRQRSVP